MSVIASVHVDMVMKSAVPDKIVDLVNEEIDLSRNGMEYYAELDGNWSLDDVIDLLEVLNPYIASGNISYWSDEGEANAQFVDGQWCDEWMETYYESDLPNDSVSSTQRVAEILNKIANDMMNGSDGAYAREVFFDICKLTDDETRLYGLEWLKDLRYV